MWDILNNNVSTMYRQVMGTVRHNKVTNTTVIEGINKITTNVYPGIKCKKKYPQITTTIKCNVPSQAELVTITTAM